MQIKIKTLTGRELELTVEPNDTILKLKERIEEKEGIYTNQQRLIYGGRAMADNKTVMDYHLKAGAFVHLVLQLR